MGEGLFGRAERRGRKEIDENCIQGEEIKGVDVRDEELDDGRLDDFGEGIVGFLGGIDHPL